MTENPYPMKLSEEHHAWNEGYAVGDIEGFHRAIHFMLDVLEKEMKDYEP